VQQVKIIFPPIRVQQQVNIIPSRKISVGCAPGSSHKVHVAT